MNHALNLAGISVASNMRGWGLLCAASLIWAEPWKYSQFVAALSGDYGYILVLQFTDG